MRGKCKYIFTFFLLLFVFMRIYAQYRFRPRSASPGLPTLGCMTAPQGRQHSAGIRNTPAYAGKRQQIPRFVTRWRDHPRVCGEKSRSWRTRRSVRGSPPRMRGKVTSVFHRSAVLRITPAYAGKSLKFNHLPDLRRDYPRICGEKKCPKAWCIGQQGSPPRMRGKVAVQSDNSRQFRITPAYAGKSAYLPRLFDMP